MSSLTRIQGPIQWSTITPEAALTHIPALIESAKSDLETIKLCAPSYKDTVLAMDQVTEGVSRAWNLIQHLNSVCNTDEMRQTIQTLQPQISDFFSAIFIDEGLWRVFQQATADRSDLNAEQLRHVEETEMAFRSNGALLSEGEKETLIQLNRDLAATTQKFSNNVLDDKQRWS